MGLDQLPYVCTIAYSGAYMLWITIQHRYLIVKLVKLSYVYQKKFTIVGIDLNNSRMKFGRIFPNE